MKGKLGSLLLAGALVAGVGCSSPPPPPPPAPATIELAAEPSVAGSYESFAWPELLKGSTAIVVPYSDDLHGDEINTLCSSFNEVFFGAGSPFVQIDQDAMVKAEQRRAVLGGTPGPTELMKLADQEKADFVVVPRIKFEERPRHDLPAPATASFIARGSCQCSGSANKGGIKTPDATLTSSEQGSNNKQRDDLRSRTIAYMGRLLAKKTLLNLTKVKGDTFDNRIEVNIKFFSSDEKSVILDAIAATGIKNEEINENASGQDEVLFKIKTKKNISDFQQNLEAALTEKNLQFEASRSGNRISVSKKR